jgi:hypothetical protein
MLTLSPFATLFASFALAANASPSAQPATDVGGVFAVYPGWDMDNSAATTFGGTELACLQACSASTFRSLGTSFRPLKLTDFTQMLPVLPMRTFPTAGVTLGLQNSSHSQRLQDSAQRHQCGSDWGMRNVSIEFFAGQLGPLTYLSHPQVRTG